MIKEINVNNQTLREVLEKIQNTALYVSVGANDGSGWLYIGRAEESINFFIRENEAWINQLKEYINICHNNITLARETVDYNIGRLISTDNRIVSIADGKIKSSQVRIDHFRKRIDSLSQILLSWTDLLDRKVIRIYHQDIVSPNTCDILFEGKETGNFWTYEEFVDVGIKKRKRSLFK
jgi:hypothetical protein